MRPGPATAAVVLSGAAAAWTAGGLFAGPLAGPAAIVGVAIGAGVVSAAYRRSPPGPSQFLVVPLALAAGTALALAGGGTPAASLPASVGDALGAGFSGAPIPFDAGWRVVLVVSFAVLGAAGSSLTFGLRRVAVGVLVPVPVLFAAALGQPASRASTSAAVAVALLAAAVAAASAAAGTRLSWRTAASAGPVIVVAGMATAVLGHTGWLLPRAGSHRSTRSPIAGAPPPDSVLFEVRSDQPGPWRTAAPETWRDGRFVGAVPSGDRPIRIGGDGAIPGLAEASPTSRVTFTIRDGSPDALPTPPGAVRVIAASPGLDLTYDGRAQVLRPAGRSAPAGAAYTVEAIALPTLAELGAAAPAGASQRELLSAPDPPGDVAALLARAPAGTWDRLAYALRALHAAVTVVPGVPGPVAPGRVTEMLAGGRATSSEVTTAEVLLARWAGVPARVGVGFVASDRSGDEWLVRAADQSTWLEVLVAGYGWVPYATLPGQATQVQPGPGRSPGDVAGAGDALLTLYVPVALRRVVRTADLTRYWVAVAAAILTLVALAWAMLAWPAKALRRGRRRWWAASRGPRARIAAAYAELRDKATDLELQRPTSTPLGFLDSVQEDAEHVELAWLVTRTLWGDLVRDPRSSDADAGEEMARSVARRLRRAQPASTRLIALMARRSLRTPFSREVPNLWPAPGRNRFARAAAGAVALTAAGAVVVAASGAWVSEPAPARAVIPDRLVPDGLPGLSLARSVPAEAGFGQGGPSALTHEGRVFTIRRGADVAGYLEVAALDPGVDVNHRPVRAGILRHLAGGRFEPEHTVAGTVYAATVEGTGYRLWFSPNGRLFELLVAFPGLTDADQLIGSLVSYQRTGQLPGALSPPAATTDARRGGDPS